MRTDRTIVSHEGQTGNGGKMNWNKSILVLVALSGLVNCSAEEGLEFQEVRKNAVTLPTGCDGGVCKVSVNITGGAEASQFAIIAKQNVRLANRSTAKHKSGNPAGVLSSSGQVLVSGYSKAGDVLGASQVNIEAGALVRGMAYSGGDVNVQQGAHTLGGEHEHEPFYLKTVSVVAPFAMPTSFGAGINLEPDRTRSVTPGAYDYWNIKSRSRLKATAGDYFLRNLYLEPQGKLEFSNDGGTVQLHVLENLNCKGDFVKASASSNIRIVYWGTNAANIECNLPDVQVIAPNGHIRVADRKTVGKLIGKSVELGADSKAVASDFQSFSSGPGDKLLVDLTDAEQVASCEAVNSRYFTPEYQEILCRVRGHMAILVNKPDTDVEARSVCSSAYDECMDREPCDGFEEPVFDGCAVTLAERDECLSEYIPALQHGDARTKACSETALYGTLAYRSNPIKISPVCARYFSCLKGDL